MTPLRRRYLSWFLIGLPVFLLVVVLVVIMQAKAFLKSDRFRTFLGSKVSRTIHAQGAFQPLEWSGSSFYTNGFSATGEPGSSLASIAAEQMRAEVNLQGLWDRKWQVQSVEIERLTIQPANKKKNQIAEKIVTPKRPSQPTPPQLSTSKPTTSKPTNSPKNTAPKTPDFFSSLLPNQVDVQRVSVANFTLDGSNLKMPFQLAEIKVEAKPDGKAWMLQGSGGTLSLANNPKISINELAVRYVDKIYFITRGSLQVEGGGSVNLSGQLGEKPQANTDLNLKIDRLPAATVLPKDWRARLSGQLSADLHAVGDGQEWVVSGPVTLADGRLEALPILDQVAVFTRTQRFRQLNLEKVTADVVIKEGNVKVSNFNLESPGLVRMTGDLVIENGILTGAFLVGVTPASLRYIPGSQAKIFTEERGGYLWTPMKVTGPLNHLTEDLTERLVIAAGQDLIDTIQKDPSKLKDTLKDAAQSILDLFGK